MYACHCKRNVSRISIFLMDNDSLTALSFVKFHSGIHVFTLVHLGFWYAVCNTVKVCYFSEMCLYGVLIIYADSRHWQCCRCMFPSFSHQFASILGAGKRHDVSLHHAYTRNVYLSWFSSWYYFMSWQRLLRYLQNKLRKEKFVLALVRQVRFFWRVWMY